MRRAAPRHHGHRVDRKLQRTPSHWASAARKYGDRVGPPTNNAQRHPAQPPPSRASMPIEITSFLTSLSTRYPGRGGEDQSLQFNVSRPGPPDVDNLKSHLRGAQVVFRLFRAQVTTCFAGSSMQVLPGTIGKAGICSRFYRRVDELLYDAPVDVLRREGCRPGDRAPVSRPLRVELIAMSSVPPPSRKNEHRWSPVGGRTVSDAAAMGSWSRALRPVPQRGRARRCLTQGRCERRRYGEDRGVTSSPSAPHVLHIDFRTSRTASSWGHRFPLAETPRCHSSPSGA